MPDIIKKNCSCLLICLLLAISSCSFQQTVEKAVDKEKDKFAREFIDGIIAGDSAILKNVDPSILTDDGLLFLDRLMKALYKAPYKSVKILGLNKHRSMGKESLYTINYEYKFDSGFTFFFCNDSRTGWLLHNQGF